jgi:hypothetical protein
LGCVLKICDSLGVFRHLIFDAKKGDGKFRGKFILFVQIFRWHNFIYVDTFFLLRLICLNFFGVVGSDENKYKLRSLLVCVIAIF